MKKILCGVNAYVFISMVSFIWLEITKNCQKWVYMGMDEIFLLEIWKVERAPKYTAELLLWN